MNIQEAKQEVILTVKAYTAKNEEGLYRIPRIRQRPVLLMGPPGIGKTAIVEQAAKECGIGLVSYTITHHTRQSAVGLPVLEKKIYNGREITVTEYTMSEIIASVYACMERTGCREGILFIDEVNCVSETLAPTMLQFLQGKTFGNHKVPSGWILVAAGNPPEYNKSVREFDVVTLDRVKKIQVEEDYPAWKTYALARGIHGAIRSYLDGKPRNFYRIEQTPEEKEFVTARGWEDLSAIIKEYEAMGASVEERLIGQYIQCPEVSRDFASYYQFYRKYQEQYGDGMERLLQGELVTEGMEACTLDEQLTLVNLLLSRILDQVERWQKRKRELGRLKEVVELLRRYMTGKEQDFPTELEAFFEKQDHALEVKEQAEVITQEEACLERKGNRQMKAMAGELRTQQIRSWEKALEFFRRKIQEEERAMREAAQERAGEMERALTWTSQSFGHGPALLTALEAFTAHGGCMEIIRKQGCPFYEEHCSLLMTADRERRLREQLEILQGTELL